MFLQQSANKMLTFLHVLNNITVKAWERPLTGRASSCPEGEDKEVKELFFH